VLDVLEFPYSGNRLHPTQKLVEPPENAHPHLHAAGQVVLDPFCGSGHTLAAAQELERQFIGIDIDPAHCQTARKRLLIGEDCLAAAA